MHSTLLAVMVTGLACGAAPTPSLTPEQVKRLREQDALWTAGLAAWEAGKQAEAAIALERALALQVRLNGPWHRTTDVIADRLGDWCRAREEWLKEAGLRRVVIEARRVLDGAGHHQTVDARLELAEAMAQAKRTPALRQSLALARRLHGEALALSEKGQAAKAIPLAAQALAIRKKVLGERHPEYALSLNNLGYLYWQMGDNKAALPLYEEALDVTREAPGERHPDHARGLNNLANLHQALGDPKKALPLYERALAIRKEALGVKHPDYALSLNNLAFLHASTGDSKAALPLYEEALAITRAALGERHPDHARGLNNLANLHQAMGDLKKALPLYERALAIRKEALGVKHPDYALSLNNLAFLYHAMGRHEAALPLYEQALAITRAALGERHPDHARGLNNLAHLHQGMGDHKTALALHEQALAIRKAALGVRHPDYALSLNNVAGLYRDMGDQRAALPLFQKALAITRAALGERHPDHARGLNNLANLHQDMGDLKAARPLLERALAIRKEALGVKHPDYALSLNNLGYLYWQMGDNKAARPLLERALAIRKEALGVKHPDYALSLNNLAFLYHAMGRHEAALPLYEEALAITRAALGERHPIHALCLNNLANLHQAMGDLKKALPLYERTLAIRKETVGEKHPDYALSLHNLAGLYHEMGRPGAALLLQEQAISLTRRQLALDAAVQSERQQLAAAAALRYRLNVRLQMPDEAAHFSHNHVLSWKGSAFAAQQARRRFLLTTADPATRTLALRLRDRTRSLALLASRVDASRERVEGLAREKEALEVRLAQLGAAFRLAVKPPSSEAFRAALPPGTVLLDFLVHEGPAPDRPLKGQEAQRRLVVWVVRADAPTRRLDLGPMRPIEEDIEAWRGAIEEGRDGGAAPTRLRAKVWAPLVEHLADARAVLLSPDEALGRLPFAALHGSKPGTYLLEEAPLAVLPVPRALAQLLERPTGEPSLLTLGGVDYGPGHGWPPLPATGPEADAIAARFRAVFKGATSTLAGEKAAKAALAEALPKHRFAHLATHGFFAPPSMKSSLDAGRKGPRGMFGREGVTGWDPALLSGLVLAGANRPTAADDGLLKASEVAEMDLSNVELAVLSACRTGLGKEAAAEGILGLQRAFALSGCKTVVSSLWSVDDAATAVLMERFYLHLWKGKKGKAEALRAAQLDILYHPEWVEDRVKKLSASGVRLRGVGKASEVIVSGKKSRRSPAAWWAPWQMSGDWR